MRRKYRLEIRQVESYLLQLKEAERAEYNGKVLSMWEIKSLSRKILFGILS